MRLQILTILLFAQACSVSESAVSKKPQSGARKTEKHLDAGIRELSKSQKDRIKLLLSDLESALAAYKNRADASEIAEKCDRVAAATDEAADSLPAGFLKNTLQQSGDAINLAYLFRYENARRGIVITEELRRQVIDAYKIGDLKQEEQADRIFNFAQAHYEIASRLATDAGVATQ